MTCIAVFNPSISFFSPASTPWIFYFPSFIFLIPNNKNCMVHDVILLASVKNTWTIEREFISSNTDWYWMLLEPPPYLLAVSPGNGLEIPNGKLWHFLGEFPTLSDCTFGHSSSSIWVGILSVDPWVHDVGQRPLQEPTVTSVDQTVLGAVQNFLDWELNVETVVVYGHEGSHSIHCGESITCSTVSLCSHSSA